MLEAALTDGAGEDDLAALHLHLDVARVEVRVIGDLIAKVLADPLVRALVALGRATARDAEAPALSDGIEEAPSAGALSAG